MGLFEGFASGGFKKSGGHECSKRNGHACLGKGSFGFCVHFGQRIQAFGLFVSHDSSLLIEVWDYIVHRMWGVPPERLLILLADFGLGVLNLFLYLFESALNCGPRLDGARHYSLLNSWVGCHESNSGPESETFEVGGVAEV